MDATVLPNPFRVPDRPGDRGVERARLGITGSERLVLHPVRAIARKGVPAALELCRALGALYWLPGPAEDGYGAQLDELLSSTKVPVLREPLRSLDDAYAAADLVAFPSTWEGFGNPPVEASLRWKPVAVGPYPVADDFRALGFSWFDASSHGTVRAFLDDPDADLLEQNRALATEHFGIDVVGSRVAALLDEAGWLP
jgi:glycosyltransferase involved in cell wall biosynthesis